MNEGPVQFPLTLKIVRVLESGQRVESPRDVIYSTSPRIAAASDGHDYILKGPEVEAVVAEATAYMLAKQIDLPVPEFGIASVNGSPYFASREVRLRNVAAFIERALVSNPSVLLNTVVFDIWMANTDRNMGNFVGEKAEDGQGNVKVYAIDFEKSACLRERTPLVKVPTIEQSKFWPRGSLGTILAGRPMPNTVCDKISETPEEVIRECLDLIGAHVDVPWADSCVQVLRDRAQRIHRLAKEVWR